MPKLVGCGGRRLLIKFCEEVLGRMGSLDSLGDE